MGKLINAENRFPVKYIETLGNDAAHERENRRMKALTVSFHDKNQESSITINVPAGGFKCYEAKGISKDSPTPSAMTKLLDKLFNFTRDDSY